MDIRVMIEWPELVAVVREHLASGRAAPQCAEKASSVGESVTEKDAQREADAPQERGTKEDKPAPDPTPTPAEQTVSLEQVRAKLAALSQAGKQESVKSLITEFGGRKLSDVPMDKYPELLAKAEELA